MIFCVSTCKITIAFYQKPWKRPISYENALFSTELVKFLIKLFAVTKAMVQANEIKGCD